MIQQLSSQTEWDICIIGGGATGLGAAVDAASRGLKTILFEQHDFAKGTSSRSTKLVHGGVRYLQQGNIKLVMEALKERGLLIKNAPHLAHNQKFVVPNYKWWEGPFYGIGLKIYDWMAGKLGLGPSEFLSKEQTLELAPTLDPEGLRGSIVYHDGQFDDARLAIAIAQTAAQHKGVLLNYFPVTGFLKTKNKIIGVQVKDALTGNSYEVKSKAVINATGIFADAVMHMDDLHHKNIVTHSQGIHLVVDKEFLPGNTAIMIPKTDDGRVLFAVPWHNKIVLGTTDTPVSKPSLEPVPKEEEINFILTHIGRYLTKDPQLSDVRSMFAGLRPLVKGKTKKTAALSRDHLITVASSGLITITGGKWTTYRRMAEDVIDIAIEKNNLAKTPCVTRELKLYGHDQRCYPPTSIATEDIKKAVTDEMCMTAEDFLSRRTRHLLLDAKSAIEAAPLVAKIMAGQMNKDENWIIGQINDFTKIAKHYIPSSNLIPPKAKHTLN
jgi:glycerol-3-phosphate dehydrogenase